MIKCCKPSIAKQFVCIQAIGCTLYGALQNFPGLLETISQKQKNVTITDLAFSDNATT
jgi:hypothetical protein